MYLAFLQQLLQHYYACPPAIVLLCTCGFMLINPVGIADKCLLEEEEQQFDIKTANTSCDKPLD